MKKVIVDDSIQHDYVYYRTVPIGKQFDIQFRPELTPKEMLQMGVFGGRYLRDCQNEFPKNWFTGAKLYPLHQSGHDKHLNYFQVEASLPLPVWQAKGWIHPDDPRGWFQWYCRYYMGRRHENDTRQIKRWISMKRHIAQILNNCLPYDQTCRKKQRQALLHWAYDSRRI